MSLSGARAWSPTAVSSCSLLYERACILVNDLKLTQTLGLKQTPKFLAESFLENTTINTQAITRPGGKAIFDDQLEIKSCKAGRIIALQAEKYIASIAKLSFGFWNIATFYFICNSNKINSLQVQKYYYLKYNVFGIKFLQLSVHPTFWAQQKK